MNREIEDYELRVYGISNTIGLQEDVVHMPDEEWVEEAEQFGYISTLDTFMHNVNKGIVAKDYPHLQFKVIAIGKQIDDIIVEKMTEIIDDKEMLRMKSQNGSAFDNDGNFKYKLRED